MQKSLLQKAKTQSMLLLLTLAFGLTGYLLNWDNRAYWATVVTLQIMSLPPVAGELTLGQLVASEIIVAAVVAAFSRLAKHFESFYDVLAATEKVGGLLDLALERGGRPERVDRASEAGRVGRPEHFDLLLDVAQSGLGVRAVGMGAAAHGGDVADIAGHGLDADVKWRGPGLPEMAVLHQHVRGHQQEIRMGEGAADVMDFHLAGSPAVP